MSREVKRVPLSFSWPLKKIWTGYLLKNCIDDCDDCREFAKIKDIPLTDCDCPKLDIFEPPAGDGWQMWETTSEGSPISPVFETPELLAQWLTDNNASAFGGMTCTYEQWLKMITGSGHAISAIFSIKTGLISGVEANSLDND